MPARKRKRKTKTKKSSKKVSRFERARLLGSRAIQISMGAKPCVKVSPEMDPIDIAMREFEEDKLPLETRNN